MNDSHNSSPPSSRTFVRLDDPFKILPVLLARLPHSANMYNMVILSKLWEDHETWCVLDGDISSDCWIVRFFDGENFTQEVNFSTPVNAKMTPEIMAALSTSPYLDWTKSYGFFSVDPHLSTPLLEYMVRVKGHGVSVRPCTVYYLDPQDSFPVTANPPSDRSVELRDMNNEDAKSFLMSTWNYALGPGKYEYADKTLSRNPSVGLYLDGKIVSGVVHTYFGRLGMLYTLPEHRGKGYAQLCTRALFRKMTEKGLVINSVVEEENIPSKAFHTKIGLRALNKVELLMYENSNY